MNLGDKLRFLLPLLTGAALAVCCTGNHSGQNGGEGVMTGNTTNGKRQTLAEMFPPPQGYERQATDAWGEYLRTLPMKPKGYQTHLHTGELKPDKVAAGVVDMDILNADQQCADAIIRLRAEYLYKSKQYSKISFTFTNGFACPFSQWMKGYRIKTDDEETITWWARECEPDSSRAAFEEYLKVLFRYCGTVSLADDMVCREVNVDELWSGLKVGDVFLNAAFPGHAVIVLDVVRRGEGTKFLLGQSFMPAQEIEVLKVERENDDPWYSASDSEWWFETIEYVFSDQIYAYTWRE